jgi:dynein heavy chain, axonemal
LKGAS